MIQKSIKRPKSKDLKQLYDSLTGGGWIISSRSAPDFCGSGWAYGFYSLRGRTERNLSLPEAPEGGY